MEEGKDFNKCDSCEKVISKRPWMTVLNKGIHKDSNFALVILVKKSMPSHKESISIFAVFPLDNVRFAFSQLVLSLLNDLLV